MRYTMRVFLTMSAAMASHPLLPPPFALTQWLFFSSDDLTEVGGRRLLFARDLSWLKAVCLAQAQTAALRWQAALATGASA